MKIYDIRKNEDESDPASRLFTSGSDRQSLDSGYSQRDSMRLEECAFSGPFCGRALVHTDFTPSPYDVESLKLQVSPEGDASLFLLAVSNLGHIFFYCLVKSSYRDLVNKAKQDGSCFFLFLKAEFELHEPLLSACLTKSQFKKCHCISRREKACLIFGSNHFIFYASMQIILILSKWTPLKSLT